jgi:lipopolysaccharide assembly protein A
MLSTIFTVIVGVAIAYFATQNTEPISIHIGQYSWAGIPLYLVVLVAFLVGLLFAYFISLLNSITSSLELRRKQQELEKTRKSLEEHTKRVHELELENTRLQAHHSDTHPEQVVLPSTPKSEKS